MVKNTFFSSSVKVPFVIKPKTLLRLLVLDIGKHQLVQSSTRNHAPSRLLSSRTPSVQTLKLFLLIFTHGLFGLVKVALVILTKNLQHGQHHLVQQFEIGFLLWIRLDEVSESLSFHIRPMGKSSFQLPKSISFFTTTFLTLSSRTSFINLANG